MAENYNVGFETTSWLQDSIWSSKPHQRQIFNKDRTSTRPKMQAISPESLQKSCGTGVFLPLAPNLQSTDKPAGFNQYADMRIRYQELNDKKNATKNKKNHRVAYKTHTSDVIYLPKEWTY